MLNKDSIHISLQCPVKEAHIRLGGSKSESNRILILRALSEGRIRVKNLSNSDDTAQMLAALTSAHDPINIGPAGTAMRFCTAYFAAQQGRSVLLSGSERMHKRPIGALVDALRAIGADIAYVGEEGFPPLRINGKKLCGGLVEMDGNVSSQFITAMLLLSPALEQGLHIRLRTELVSAPYVNMTLSLLERCGIRCSFEGRNIVIPKGQDILSQDFTVESDWSSASYYFSYAAIAAKAGKPLQITLNSLLKTSLQGDSAVRNIYRQYFGIHSRFDGERLTLSCTENFSYPEWIELNLEATPDIAQTIACTMGALKMKGRLTGLGTLRVKETDRIAALHDQLAKFGVVTTAGEDFLEVTAFEKAQDNICLKTYEDHRMAMAFAPLSILTPLRVEEPGVVIKSYPDFWEDFCALGGVLTP